jgi:hypothetical protein
MSRKRTSVLHLQGFGCWLTIALVGFAMLPSAPTLLAQNTHTKASNAHMVGLVGY